MVNKRYIGGLCGREGEGKGSRRESEEKSNGNSPKLGWDGGRRSRARKVAP